jgi:hypothetical protein
MGTDLRLYRGRCSPAFAKLAFLADKDSSTRQPRRREHVKQGLVIRLSAGSAAGSNFPKRFEDCSGFNKSGRLTEVQ